MKLSVGVLTYNQEAFVNQSITSILEQETSFPFEVIIGDDCSTDRTGEIVRSYAERRPDIVRVLPRKSNIGAFRNVLEVYRACQGEYIAWLEGDDYWTDRKKLQKQVDFLDNHHDCVLCFGRAQEFYNDNPACVYTIGPEGCRERYTLNDILVRNFIPTCTVMYRKDLLESYPDWAADLLSTDWLTYIMLAQQGNLGFLPQTLAARRILGSGLWGSLSHLQRLENSIKTHLVLSEQLAPECKSLIQRGLNRRYFQLAVELEYIGRRADAWRCFLQHGRGWIRNPSISNLSLLKLLIKFGMPWRYGRNRRTP